MFLSRYKIIAIYIKKNVYFCEIFFTKKEKIILVLNFKI